MAESAPSLVLERGGRIVLASYLDGSAPAPIEVDETEAFGFCLTRAEPALEYRLRMGVLPLEWTFEGRIAGEDPAGGRRVGEQIFWSELPHFDSASGPTLVHLESRHRLGGEDWTERAVLPVDVVPGKIGPSRYAAMADELRALAPGLLYDVVGKSAHRASAAGAPPLSTMLSALAAAWREVEPALRRLGRYAARQPAQPIPARGRTARWRFDPGRAATGDARHLATAERSTSRMTATRFAASRRPFDASGRPFDAVAAGLLDLMADWAAACARAATAEIRNVEKHRDYRDVRIGGRRSVWENVDVPHIERMRNAFDHAAALHTAIISLRRRSPWSRAEPVPAAALRSVVRSDARLANVARALTPLFASPNPEVHAAEYLKLTHRLFEQWVLLEIVAAFRAVGLESADDEPLLPDRPTSVHVDLDRGATWVFNLRNQRVLRLRYEPWIHPIELATEFRDPLFRDGDEPRSWSPDIVIERVRPSRTGHAAGLVEDAIVVDVKYTLALTDAHWARALKYLMIRERRSGRPVVREVWLACAAPGSRVLPLDDTAASHDTDWPRARSRGIIEIPPPPRFNAGAGPFARPAAAATAFTTHVLRQLDG